MSPRSAVRVSNLTPQLVLQNAAGTFDPSAALSYVFEVFEVDGSTQTLVVKSDPIAAGSPQTIYNVPSNVLKLNKTYAWRAYAMYPVCRALVQGSHLRRRVVQNAAAAAAGGPNTPGPIFCAGAAAGTSSPAWPHAFPARLVKTNAGDFSDERRSRTTWSSSATALSRPANARV